MRDAAAVSGPGSLYLVCRVEGECFALPVERVREIIAYREPTRVPNVPDFLRGFINLRGEVVPVADTRIQFGLARREYGAFDVIVVVNMAGKQVGMIVEEVRDVVALAPEEIRDRPAASSRLRLEFLAGVATSGGAVLLILDLDRLLTDEEVGVLDDVSERGGALEEGRA